MKLTKYIFLLIAFCSAHQSVAQDKQMVIYRNGLSPLYIDIADIDSITIADRIDNVHEYTDLGLSVLWANTNLGAEKPEDYGYYFAWGETETKQEFTVDNYRYADNDGYTTLPQNIAATEYDAAAILWKGNWRMPTIEEIEELTKECTWTWTSINNINGYRVVGPSGKDIFLPAAGQWRNEPINVGATGYYWSASISDEYSTAAYNLNFTGFTGRWSANRAYGFSIRPVCR